MTKAGSVAEPRFRSKRPEDGQRWGKWKLCVSPRPVLEYWDDEYGEREYLYQIDLEDVVSSARMLDWIFQLNGKTWASAEDIGDLVRAFDTIFYPQANLCSGGGDKRIDASYLKGLFGQ